VNTTLATPNCCMHTAMCILMQIGALVDFKSAAWSTPSTQSDAIVSQVPQCIVW
jgi:hypothetical protein